jgi:hypothetical protein
MLELLRIPEVILQILVLRLGILTSLWYSSVPQAHAGPVPQITIYHGHYLPHQFQITAHWPPVIRPDNIMNKEIKEIKTNPAILESAM